MREGETMMGSEVGTAKGNRTWRQAIAGLVTLGLSGWLAWLPSAAVAGLLSLTAWLGFTAEDRPAKLVGNQVESVDPGLRGRDVSSDAVRVEAMKPADADNPAIRDNNASQDSEGGLAGVSDSPAEGAAGKPAIDLGNYSLSYRTDRTPPMPSQDAMKSVMVRGKWVRHGKYKLVFEAESGVLVKTKDDPLGVWLIDGNEAEWRKAVPGSGLFE